MNIEMNLKLVNNAEKGGKVGERESVREGVRRGKYNFTVL